MSYCTPVDVRKALAPGPWPTPGGQSRVTNTAADLDDDQLNDAINEASQTVDVSLSKRYAVPAGQVNGSYPAPLPTWTRDIAAYLATLSYRRGKDLQEADPVVRRYRAAMADLYAVRDGKSALSLSTNASTGGTANAGDSINPYGGHLFAPSDFGLGYAGGGVPGPGIWTDRPYW